MTFLKPPTITPLYPNLRNLRCKYTEKTMHLLHLPLPSFLYLNVEFENPQLFQNSLKSFPRFSPNMRTPRICVFRLAATCSKVETNYICRWRNLWSVFCSEVALNLDDVVHLSHMPASTQLDFTLDVTLPVSDSRLRFSHLRDITLRSESLHPISRFLTQTQLSVITNFTASIRNSPSMLELTSFFAGIQISNPGCTIEQLTLDQTSSLPNNVVRSEARLLCMEHFRPCMVLSNSVVSISISSGTWA